MNRSAPIIGKDNRREPANQLYETKYDNLTNPFSNGQSYGLTPCHEHR